MILEAKRKAAAEENKPGPSKTKTKRKKSPLELHKELINETKNDERNVTDQILKEVSFIIIIFSKRVT